VLPIIRTELPALHRARRPAGERRSFAVPNLQRKAARHNGFLRLSEAREGVPSAIGRFRIAAVRGNRECPKSAYAGNAWIDCHVDA